MRGGAARSMPRSARCGSSRRWPAALSGVFEAFGPPPLGRDLEMSSLVLDRNGKLLRAYLTSEGRWRLPATREQVDPRFLEALLAYEDKRFFSHHGVDPLAFMRAAYQLLTHGRIVSGGSTLTMQVARLLEPRESARSTPRSGRRSARCSSNGRSARMRSSGSISRSRPMAAISKASARHRSPISARSRAGSHWARRRSWWRCRNRRNIAGPTATPKRQSARATACSTASRAMGCSATPRSRMPSKRRCRPARKPMPLVAPHAADQALSARRRAS